MMESELSLESGVSGGSWKVRFPWKVGFPDHAKDQKRRLTDAKMVLLSKFKSELISYTDEDISVFKVRVTDAMKAKKKEDFDRAVAQSSRDAQAAAQAAAPRGLIGRMLG